MSSTVHEEEEKKTHIPVQSQDSDLSGASHKRTQGKRLKEGAAHTVTQDEKIGGDLKFQKNAPFLAERKKIFDELFEEQTKKYKGKHRINYHYRDAQTEDKNYSPRRKGEGGY